MSPGRTRGERTQKIEDSVVADACRRARARHGGRRDRIVLARGAAGPTHSLSVALTGANGVGTITTPGLSCADGGQGNYRRLSIDGGLAPGTFSSLATHLRGTFDVHHDGVEPPVGPVVPAAPAPSAFLLGTESHVTLSNTRGAMQLRLASGNCASPVSGAGPTLAFDGTTFATTGNANTWSIDPASPSSSGAYRQASGPAPSPCSPGSRPARTTRGRSTFRHRRRSPC